MLSATVLRRRHVADIAAISPRCLMLLQADVFARCHAASSPRFAITPLLVITMFHFHFHFRFFAMPPVYAAFR